MLTLTLNTLLCMRVSPLKLYCLFFLIRILLFINRLYLWNKYHNCPHNSPDKTLSQLNHSFQEIPQSPAHKVPQQLCPTSKEGARPSVRFSNVILDLPPK